MSTKKIIFNIIISIPLILLHTSTLSAGKVYRWVDDQGQTHYGDKIPQQYIKKERHELSPQGIKQSTTKAAKTSQQLAEEKRIKAEEAARQKVIAEKKQYDDMLLATFTTEDDLIRSRDGKHGALEGSIRLTEASLVRLHKNIDALHKKLAKVSDKQGDYATKLNNEIKETEKQILQQQTYIVNKKREQEKIITEFNKDIERFRELIQQRDAIPNDPVN